MTELQEIEFGLLQQFLSICEQLNLTYYLVCGSALGAAKYSGFIPWDDDIDIGFLRKDYDRFLALAKEELSDKYEVLNAIEDQNYPLPTTRLVKKGTVFHEEPLKNCKCNFGIFLDLYSFDNAADDEKAMRL